MMKNKTLLTVLFLIAGIATTFGCELCKKNQPRILENITHGTGPTGMLDYIITWSAAIIVTITLVLSVKFLIRPKETDNGHIKNIVLNDNN